MTIPLAEIQRRWPALLHYFGKPTDDDIPVIACRNVDTSLLPRGPGIPALPEPSILHSIVKCDVCGEDCWIGPVQASTAGTRTCYVCLAILAMVDAFPQKTAHLNPNEADIPRRRST